MFDLLKNLFAIQIFRIKNKNINLVRVVSDLIVETNVNSKIPFVTSVKKGHIAPVCISKSNDSNNNNNENRKGYRKKQ